MANAKYANPLAHAKVRPERIDQGVDYAGTGTLTAIARGVVTKVVPPSSSGWPGYYIEYTITDVDSPLAGQPIYYAEGVTPRVHVGQTVNAGDPIADLIPGWHSGIELGFASGAGTSAYAQQHGGYSEGQQTRAGDVFSALIQALGGPAGVHRNISDVGSAPGGATQAIAQAHGQKVVAGGAIQTAAGAVGSAIDAGQAIGKFVDNPLPVLLYIMFVGLGAALLYTGAGRMLGFNAPLSSTLKHVPVVGKVAA